MIHVYIDIIYIMKTVCRYVCTDTYILHENSRK